MVADVSAFDCSNLASSLDRSMGNLIVRSKVDPFALVTAKELIQGHDLPSAITPGSWALSVVLRHV